MISPVFGDKHLDGHLTCKQLVEFHRVVKRILKSLFPYRLLLFMLRIFFDATPNGSKSSGWVFLTYLLDLRHFYVVEQSIHP